MSDIAQAVTYDRRLPVLVFADTGEGLEQAGAIVVDAGARLAGARMLEDAIACLDEQIDVGAVVLDVREDHGAPLYKLLDRLDISARERRHASLVLLPGTLIDIVAAHSKHADVTLLADSTEEDQRDALIRALERSRATTTQLAERPRDPVQLMQLSEEVGRIAKALASMSELEDGPPDQRGGKAEKLTAATVRAVIRARRLREQFFDPVLFADPAWDMLLDLMAARLEGRPVAVSSLCIAAAVPPTTALRWMKQLTDIGLLVRVADPRDGRRVFIELSDEAAAGVAAFFSAFSRIASISG